MSSSCVHVNGIRLEHGEADELGQWELWQLRNSSWGRTDLTISSSLRLDRWL